ncbi:MULTISPECIES: hypothetical protein [unclassified Sinorhizobium]|uniref:hypothetical protein n=1 Tax=unclassified Sinorhizobium TaxID=2613772 RepID=UPI0035269B28
MKVSDCTLRDYLGSALVNASSLDCLAIAGMLSELDIDELEIGDPFSYEQDVALLKSLRTHVPVATFYGPKQVSTLRADLEWVKSLGVDGIVISIPASDQFAKIKLPVVDWSYRFELVSRALEISDEIGLYAVATGEDSPSAEITYLKEYLSIVHCAGAQKFRYAESISKSLPVDTYQRVKELLEAVPDAQIEMHCHDMFGLGLANGVAGVQAGATWISGTFLGAGERGGNINTIDALAVSKFLCGQSQRNLQNIGHISRKLADALGMSFLSSQRVIGEKCFAFEQPNPLFNQQVYLPFDPGEVGQSVSVVLTGKHPIETIQYVADKAGISCDKNRLSEADVRIRHLLMTSGTTIDQQTAAMIIRQL